MQPAIMNRSLSKCCGRRRWTHRTWICVCVSVCLRLIHDKWWKDRAFAKCNAMHEFEQHTWRNICEPITIVTSMREKSVRSMANSTSRVRCVAACFTFVRNRSICDWFVYVYIAHFIYAVIDRNWSVYALQHSMRELSANRTHIPRIPFSAISLLIVALLSNGPITIDELLEKSHQIGSRSIVFMHSSQPIQPLNARGVFIASNRERLEIGHIRQIFGCSLDAKFVMQWRNKRNAVDSKKSATIFHHTTLIRN